MKRKEWRIYWFSKKGEMTMSQIHVSVSKVRDIALSLKQINLQLSQCLEEMVRQMNALESSWESETSQMIRDKFNALSPHFENYAKVIDSYVAYLNQTADNYEATEASLSKNASSFQ